MPDYIADIMNAQFMGIPTIAIIIVLVAAIIIIWKKKPKEPKYKEIEPAKEDREKYKELIKLTGRKVNKNLMQGLFKVGEVGKYSDKGTDAKVYEFYYNPLAKIKRVLHFRTRYALIPNNALVKTADKFIEIDPAVSYDNNFGILTFGKEGKEQVYDESFKVNSENQIKALINWLPIQSYLSVQHAQGSESLDHLAEIEKAKKDEAISEMTGKKKK